MKDKLGNHIQQVRGVSYKPNDLSETLSDGYITLLRANNISEGKINFDSVQFVSSSKVSSEQILKTNDILVCSSSGSLSLVGKSALYKKTGEHTFGAFCKVVRATGKLLPQYIAFYMCSQAYRRHIENIANGANINNLRNEHLDDILLPIPSETKQNAIITKLEKVESVISHRRTQLAKLDELVKCRFVEMFGDWKTNPLNLPQISGKELFVFSSGKFLSTDKRKEFGVPVYGGNGIAWYTDKPLIQEPTIIIGRVGAFCGNIHSTKQPVWITDNAIYIKHCKKEIDHVFLTELMTQMNFHQYADFSGQPKITQKPLEEMKYILPTLKQQNAFAAFVRRIDKLRFVVETSHNHKHFTI